MAAAGCSIVLILCSLGLTLGTVFLKPSGVVRVYKGRRVQLVCILKNDTKPSFTEFPSFLGVGPHFKRVPNSANLTVLWQAPDTMVLRISDFSESDEGLYICGSSLAGFETVTLLMGKMHNTCGVRMFPCMGRCIPPRFLCDHVNDCPDKSDERDCDVNCTSMFVCNNGQCIDPALVCDRFNSKNCRDGSDELNCEKSFGMSPDGRTPSVLEYDHGPWHFNIIYGVVASLIVLICVIGTVLITVCRLQLRRAVMRRRMERHLANIRWRDNIIYYPVMVGMGDDVDDDDTSSLSQPCLALNIERLPGPPPLGPPLPPPGGGLVTPPPYSEAAQIEEDKLQPPPYSAVDTVYQGEQALNPLATGPPPIETFRPLPSLDNEDPQAVAQSSLERVGEGDLLPPSYTDILSEETDLGEQGSFTQNPPTVAAMTDTDSNQGVPH